MQADQWQRLWRAKTENRLPHALMLSGVKGTNKAAFARKFAQGLLCEQAAKLAAPCGLCHACRLVTNGAHPNVLWIEPEKAGHAIKVDQVRGVIDFVAQTSLSGTYRVVIVHPADMLNLSAANALLKTLEEPANDAIIILINDLRGRIPATIMSRCQRILFAEPSQAAQREWLATQPTREAVNLALTQLGTGKRDAVSLAADFAKLEPVEAIDHCLSFLLDLLKLQAGGEPQDLLNQDHLDSLQQLQHKTTMDANGRFLETCYQLRKLWCQGFNLNKQLAFESALMAWDR